MKTTALSKQVLQPINNMIVIGGNQEIVKHVCEFLRREYDTEDTEGVNIIKIDRKAMFDAVNSQAVADGIWKDKQNILEYVSNPANMISALYHARCIKSIVQKGQDVFFSIKDIVNESNMTLEGAKNMIDIIHPFGLVEMRKIGEEIQYRILDTDILRKESIMKAKEDMMKKWEENSKHLDELIDWVTGVGSVDSLKIEDIELPK
jgi:hypothetical protein